MSDSFELVIGDVRRVLPVSLIPGTTTRIAFLDVLGDVELLDVAARELVSRAGDFDVILGADTVGLVVAHHVALVSQKPYACARKKRTPQMVSPLTASAQSVAATSPSTFFLDDKHVRRLEGRRVLVVDEVCSTGSTLQALASLAHGAGAASVRLAVIATEGQQRDDVLSLTHLPMWTDQ